MFTTTVTGVALAAGPSVPLPGTASTPVTEQKMDGRAPDQATTEALRGDQPGGTAPDGGGTPTATPLSPSGSWDVTPNTGDFSWNYPLRVPPAPGGFEPELALKYSSSSVDGRTSATNNQASWAGDGWDLSAGFVERSYGSCAEDKTGGTTPPKESGDLCWRTDNAVSPFGELIRDDSSGGFRLREDNGSRVERRNGADNGDNDGEHWRITTPDGTQYLFGSRKDSAWTVPVYGDDDKEPCHGASFAASSCTQVWRWNLDKVIDRHGNVITYTYAPETNSYGANNKDTAVSYVRGGTLQTIEYGNRDGQQATGRVEFATADRCVPGSNCTPDKKDNWPDVPWDDKCDTATCKDKHAPTFWSTKRLDKITTKVWNGTGWSDTDRWQLEQLFPAAGAGEKAALWLKGITHTGLAGTPVVLPQVTFEGKRMPNRVFHNDGVGPLLRYRLTGIVSDSGGVTTIKYAEPDCTANPAKPETNTLRCFPARWSKKDMAERTDYFHKYVVEEVTRSDRISANTEMVSRYSYLDGATWALDDSEVIKEEWRTWNQFRGFGRVQIRHGKADDLHGPVTLTEKRFHRGMGGRFTDSENMIRVDDEWLRGKEYESQTRLGDTDTLVDKTIRTFSVQGPTAARGARKAYIVQPGSESVFTTITGAPRRVTRTERTYDDRAQLLTVNDLGDTSMADDDKCTRNTYARNTDKWLLTPVSRVEVVSAACTVAAQFPADAISDTRNAFDGKAFGEAPVTGNVTRVEVARERPAAGPVWALASTASFDVYGRSTSAGDALGKITTTKYVPADGIAKDTIVTNPLGHATTVTTEPFFGQQTVSVDANDRRTETTYDALGRRTEVWLPNRDRSSGTRGSVKFTYQHRKDAPTVVSTSRIGANGTPIDTNEIYDGLLRLRQVQSPAHGGGRLIVDTRYDSQGRKFKTTKPYFTDSAVDDKLWVASDADIPSQEVTNYDGAGRTVEVTTKAGAADKWSTRTQYFGNRTVVTPPAGGTPTETVTNARDQVVESKQSNDTTKYTYTPSGELETVTDPAGSVWRWTYDLRGRKVKEESPDRGTSSSVYDDEGRMISSTDARGVTLTYENDDLGRRTKTKQGITVLADRTYDTVSNGKGFIASETHFVGGNAYKTETVGYNALNQSLGTTVTIPAVEQTLAGTYTSYRRYGPDGSLSGTTFAAIGDLPAQTVKHEYNDLGKISKTYTEAGGETKDLVTATDYTRYGELARTQLGEPGKRVWLSRYYDTNLRRLERTIVDAEVPNPMQADTRYTYNDFGSITSVADRDDVQCFRSDALQRLTEAWTPSGGCAADPSTAALSGPAPYWHSYTYDKTGNRLSETQHASGGDTVRTWTFSPAGGAHQVKSITTKTPSGTKTETYGYDAAGNTTQRSGQTLDWDAEGNLVKVTEGTRVTEFVQGVNGGRLIRRDGTSITLYLDGQELRLVKATGKLEPTRYYEHGDDVVAVRDGKGTSWLAGDYQGTSQIAINTGDLTVSKRRQLPFGGSRGPAVTFPGEKGFVGGTIDGMAGLTQIGARAYDVTLGRFLSVDPIFDPNDSQQMHGYTYSSNDPITKHDPTGLLPAWLSITASVVGFLAPAASLICPPCGLLMMGVSVVIAAIDTVQSLVKGDYGGAALASLGVFGGVAGRVAGMVGKSTHAVEAYGVTTAAVGTLFHGGAHAAHDIEEAHNKQRKAAQAKPTHKPDPKYANTNLGTGKPKMRNKGKNNYYDNRGRPVNSAADMGPGGKYETPDGLIHQGNGKGWAMF
ncbi:RHS repeat-associated core domain-containing protein [Lentzea indica]|uniref:RHS repeat-associated core domain-containing protein n=1 Tax=Lentzea indica TaxID=2604800 RepID=UPI00143A15F8|nr:RHS repeat-associated core domain-containing protein [Lentzea indica]